MCTTPPPPVSSNYLTSLWRKKVVRHQNTCNIDNTTEGLWQRPSHTTLYNLTRKYLRLPFYSWENWYPGNVNRSQSYKRLKLELQNVIFCLPIHQQLNGGKALRCIIYSWSVIHYSLMLQIVLCAPKILLWNASPLTNPKGGVSNYLGLQMPSSYV